MSMVKVVDWIDIDAPRPEVFQMILNLERRLQLSPLYGSTSIQKVTDDYPHEGSRYSLRLRDHDEYCYDSVVTDFLPESKFAYCLQIRRKTRVTWLFQETPRGTRLVYEEEFDADEREEGDFITSVREVVKQWLKNIKMYAELYKTKSGMLIKWVMDKFYLKLRADQRNVILAALFMHIIGFVSFVMAAIAVGIANYL